MADLDALLVRAVPRLGKGDRKAAKLRTKLTARVGALWNGGPRRLKRVGLEIGDHAPIAAEGDALLAAVREQAGDRALLKLVRAAWKDLSRQLAERKQREEQAAEAAPPPRRPRREPAAEPAPALTISSHDELEEGEPTLAVPDDSGIALAVPDDEDEAPALALPDELEITIARTEEAPLGIRFGGDEAPSAPAEEDDADPARAADRALARWRRTGEPEELTLARRLYKEAVKASKGAGSPVAAGAARGGLALATFLAGKVDEARAHGEKALALFPAEPSALEVLCRADWPQEAARERTQALLRRAEAAFARGDEEALDGAQQSLEKALPREPFAPLIALARAAERRGPERTDLAPAIAAAWKRYPASEAFADLPLGPSLEAAIARGCLEWLRARVDADEGGAVLAQTVKEVEARGNTVAGAFQLALGLSRVALAARPEVPAAERQQLLTWIGHGLFAAQHYDAAADVYGRARAVDRNSGLLPEINKSETQCGVMKRAFDRPGVKARGGAFDDVGFARYRKALGARLERALRDAEALRAELGAAQGPLLEALLADPKRRQRIQAAARRAGQDDPFAPLDALDAEQQALGEQAVRPAASGGGLFGRMKAGMSKAIDKAKSAALGAVVASKRKQALDALGHRLREQPDGGWGDAELDAFAERAERLAPRLELLEEQAAALREAVARTGQSA